MKVYVLLEATGFDIGSPSFPTRVFATREDAQAAARASYTGGRVVEVDYVA